MAFIAIGKIGIKAPSLVTSDMVIVQRLFTVLTEVMFSNGSFDAPVYALTVCFRRRNLK